MDSIMPLALDIKDLGKRHGKNWILRGLNFSVTAGSAMALLGANGSGKSSLLRMLCGLDPQSEGEVRWQQGQTTVDREALAGAISYCAPDQSLILDLTVEEHIAFHFKFRHPLPGTDESQTLSMAILEEKKDIRVRNLSSGMRQRLALSLAFSTQSLALFLDEPTSHLDAQGRAWYVDLMSNWTAGRTLVVSSNHNENEFPKGTERFTLT